MEFDPGNHAQMTYLIQREKESQEQLDEARQEVLLWVKRGKLAIQADRPDLAREAKARATEAKTKFDQAQRDLQVIQLEKEALKERHPEPDHEATIRAEVLVEQFRMQGFSPEEQEADEIAKRIQAELELAAIKAPPARVEPEPAELELPEEPSVAVEPEPAEPELAGEPPVPAEPEPAEPELPGEPTAPENADENAPPV